LSSIFAKFVITAKIHCKFPMKNAEENFIGKIQRSIHVVFAGIAVVYYPQVDKHPSNKSENNPSLTTNGRPRPCDNTALIAWLF